MSKTNKIFNCLIIFTILLLTISSFVILFKNLNNYFNLFLIFFLFATILGFIIFLYIKNKKDKNYINNYYKKILIIIIIITFFIRFILSLSFLDDMNQLSDCANVIKTSTNFDFNIENFFIFPHWVLISFIYGIIGKFFVLTQLTIVIFNSLICSLIVLMIYKLTNLFTANKKIALIAGLIFALLPSNIYYVNLATAEFVAALLYLISIYLFIKAISVKIENKIFNYKQILLIIFSSIILSLSLFFKQFSLVILIAEIMILLILIFKNFKLKNFLNRILIIITICITYFLFVNITYFIINQYLTTSNNVNKNTIPYFLNTGLNKISNGQWNKEIWDKYINCNLESNYNYQKCNNIMKKDLINSLKNQNVDYYIDLFFKKSYILFGKDDYSLEILKVYSDKDGILEKNKAKYEVIKLYSNCYYYLLIFFMIIGIISALRKIKTNNLIYILPIIIFGSICMLLLSEAQSRYKMPIMPIVCIISSYGIYEIIKKRKK